jgi:hypothetical protein
MGLNGKRLTNRTVDDGLIRIRTGPAYVVVLRKYAGLSDRSGRYERH